MKEQEYTTDPIRCLCGKEYTPAERTEYWKIKAARKRKERIMSDREIFLQYQADLRSGHGAKKVRRNESRGFAYLIFAKWRAAFWAKNTIDDYGNPERSGNPRWLNTTNG